MSSRTISNWDSSLALQLPAAFARQMHLEEGAKFQLAIDGKRLVIQRVESEPDANVFFAAVKASQINTWPRACGYGAREGNALSVPAQGDIIAVKPELDAKGHEQQGPHP